MGDDLDSFWSWPLVVVVPLLLFVMAAAHQLGRRAHARIAAEPGGSGDGSGDEGFILSGVLGLLALLMAFSFSMALDRLEDRRDLMLQETSAIGYLAMLADGLPQAQGAALKSDLAAYGKARLATVLMPDGAARAVAEQTAADMREPIAETVTAVLREGPPGEFPIALASAYDAVEDTAVRRRAMTQAHLPIRVLWLLVVYVTISAAMLGYALAASRARHGVASTTLYLLFALAFGVILDIDRPREGAIVVDQSPFAQMVEALDRQNRQQADPLTPAPRSPAVLP